MFKRLWWLSIGATLGVSTSWWVTRTVRHKLERYAPTRLTSDLAGRARAAVTDGRQAMHDQEELLRAQLEGRYQRRLAGPDPGGRLVGSWTPTGSDAPTPSSSLSGATRSFRHRG